MTPRRALVYLPAVVILTVEALVLWPSPLHVGDWFQFWYAGRIVVTGGSPFDPAAWRSAAVDFGTFPDGVVVNQFAGMSDGTLAGWARWLYPPWTAALFVPIGALPLTAGLVVLHVGLLVTGVAALLWLVGRLGMPPPAAALALAIGAALEPFVLATRTGHFSGLLLIGALCIWSALQTGSVRALVIGAIILSLKPHLAVVFAIVVALELARRRAWRQIAVAGASLVTFALIFLIRYPPPLALVAGATYARATTDDSATTWSLAEQLLPGAGLALGTLALVVGAMLAWTALRLAPSRLRVPVLAAVTLSLSLAASPYVHTYDQMLLVPALLVPLAIAAPLPGPHRLALGTATVTVALLYPWIAYFSDVDGRQAPTGAVPFLAIGLVTVATWSAARHDRLTASPPDLRVSEREGVA